MWRGRLIVEGYRNRTGSDLESMTKQFFVTLPRLQSRGMESGQAQRRLNKKSVGLRRYTENKIE